MPAAMEPAQPGQVGWIGQQGGRVLGKTWASGAGVGWGGRDRASLDVQTASRRVWNLSGPVS